MRLGGKALYAAAITVGLGTAVGGVEQKIENRAGISILEKQLYGVGRVLTSNPDISRETADSVYTALGKIYQLEKSPVTGFCGLGLVAAAEGLRRRANKKEDNESEWKNIRENGLSKLYDLRMTSLPEEIARLISEASASTQRQVNFLELSSINSRALEILTEGVTDLGFQKIKIADTDVDTLCKFKGKLRLGAGVKISPVNLQALIEGFQGHELDLNPEILKGQMESSRIAEAKAEIIRISATKDVGKNCALMRHLSSYKGRVILDLPQDKLTFEEGVVLAEMREAKDISIMLRENPATYRMMTPDTAAKLEAIGPRFQMCDKHTGGRFDLQKAFRYLRS